MRELLQVLFQLVDALKLFLQRRQLRFALLHLEVDGAHARFGAFLCAHERVQIILLALEGHLGFLEELHAELQPLRPRLGALPGLHSLAAASAHEASEDSLDLDRRQHVCPQHPVGLSGSVHAPGRLHDGRTGLTT
eukprot:scaffold447_cov307-Pinguiococcus_pyrenoidosus.AAC.53